jgi:hypothetical protein
LQCCNKTDDWEKIGKRYREPNCTQERGSLPQNNASDAQHLEIVRESPSQHKFLQLRVKGIE